MTTSLLTLFLVPTVFGKNQIGHVPIKGNLFRAKFAEEIVGNASAEFTAFSSSCRTSVSEETGITYFYSQKPYTLADVDDTICAYSLDRNIPASEITGQASQIANFTLYFVCDDTCCAMECCQRDIQMTIIGTGLITISLLILMFYAFIFLSGLFCAWRNGSLGRRHTHSADTSLIVIKNNHV